MTNETKDFALTSDELRVLLAFEETQSIYSVARRIRRDPSVVSRLMQSIASKSPIVEKHLGRWRVTQIGQQVSAATRQYFGIVNQLLNEQPTQEKQEPQKKLPNINEMTARLSG